MTLINSDVHCNLCKVYNRVDSSNITSQTWKFYFFRFFRQKTETEFWLLYIKIPKSDYLYKYALGNLKSYSVKVCQNGYNILELFFSFTCGGICLCRFRLLIGCHSVSSQLFLSLQYLKFSEVIWFLRRNSCKIIILLWHFPCQKQNFLRKVFSLLLFSPIDSKLSNPYTKHVYLNLMFFNISYYMENLESTTLELLCIQSPWWKFWS